jgi:N-acyl-D-aspartate/D-glutamate deacylase
MAILLKNGKIYDGTGNKPYIGNILIVQDRIDSIGKEIADDSADQIIDLAGLSVSSGFVDAHSHNDWFAIKKNPLPYFEPFIKQGITTFITGNCGVSSTGFEPESPYAEKLGGGLFAFQNLSIYDCFPKFLRASLLGKGASIERTIRKMTGQIADRFSLKDRGYIKAGNYADITVFDEEALKSAVPNQQKSFGIEKVFMNGKLIFSDNQINEAVVKNAGYAVRTN